MSIYYVLHRVNPSFERRYPETFFLKDNSFYLCITQSIEEFFSNNAGISNTNFILNIMNSVAQLKENQTFIEFVKMVKNQVDELYEKQQIFCLSLETLELTRRFKNQYLQFKISDDNDPVELNRFFSLTQHLERNLVQELK